MTNIQYMANVDMDFPGGASKVKHLPGNAGDIRDMGSIPGLGRSSGGWIFPVFQNTGIPALVFLTEES